MRIEIKDASSKDFMFFKTFHHFRKIISLTGFNDSENPCKKDFVLAVYLLS